MTSAARLACVAFMVAAAAPCARAQKPSANLHEVWSVLSDSGLFQAPRSLVVTNDCTVWIADPASGAWRTSCIFGGIPTKVESDSAGPHTLQSAAVVVPFRGDTVAVWDQTAGQLAFFGPGGAFLRARPLALPVSTGRPLAFTFPDAATVQAWTVTSPVSGAGQSRAYVMSVRDGSGPADSLLTQAGPLSFVFDTAAVGAVDAPLQRKPFVSFFRSGGFIAGRNDRAMVDVFDASGRRQRSVLLPLPVPGHVTKADRDAYTDSARRALERQMAARGIDDTVRVRLRQQMEPLIRDAVYPDSRQYYDQLVLDEKEATVWVLLPATGPEYDRTWMICSLTELSYCRTQSIPHQGAVVAVAIHGSAVYAIEQTRDGMSRVAKYDSQ